MPAVSICIPSYNSGPYLAATIESALAQEFEDFELIICDNASTDETPALCRAYHDSRIRYHRFEELVGQAANWNRCLTLATAENITLLHGDDLLAPSYLTRALQVLNERPDVAMLFCCAEHIDAHGQHLLLQSAYPEDRIEPGEAIARRLLLKGCFINPAGVLVRRSAYQAVGAFTEEILWGVDWHMWTRLALHGAVAYLSEPLSRYRIHGQSGTSGVMRTARNAKDERWMFVDLFSRSLPAGSPLQSLRAEVNRGIAHRTWCFAEEMCATGFAAAARAQLRAAFQTRPAIALEGRFWLLWASSYWGYEWFQKALTLRRKLAHS